MISSSFEKVLLEKLNEQFNTSFTEEEFIDWSSDLQELEGYDKDQIYLVEEVHYVVIKPLH